MALFQEWHLLNNIDDNISLLEKLLDKNNNNYYYLSEIELEELFEKLNEFKKFKILVKIKDDIIKDKDFNYKYDINQLKRKIKNQDNYINKIHLYSIISLLFIITFYFNHFYFF